MSEFLTLGMSGQVQSVMYGHDLSVSLSYDGVGRAVGMSGPGGMLWQADEYDSGGRLVRESFGNGVTQVTTRDVLGLPSRVQVERPVMAGPLYDVAVTRNAWTGILSATDSDGVGLNHSASFTYDGAARLTDASIGTGSEMYNFGYRYDGLQNMTLRTQAGPSTLDMVAGTYQYGEAGAGPRQLTSVVDGQSTEVANFTYDAAGRMTEDTGKLLTYNGLDQLVHVDLPGAMVPLVYSYGYNGQRTYTQHADGSEEYNFTESIRQEDDLRHHYLKIGSRTVARISMRDLEAGGGSGGGLVATPPVDTQGSSPLRTLLLLLLFSAIALAASRRGRKPRGIRAGPAWAMAPLLVLFASNISCGALFGSTHQATWTTDQTIYFHQGFSAGPTMMTDEAGNIFEERRYEPFGVDIDAYSGVAGGIGPTGSIDFAAEPTNILNKASDRDTKWSYHGARWVAPQTARWHTPDPIVKAPDAKFMAEPWALHPYQYVGQNPVIYWDPDGRERACSVKSGTCWENSSPGIAKGLRQMANGLAPTGSPNRIVANGAIGAIDAVGTHIGEGAAATFNFAEDMKQQYDKENYGVMLYRGGEFVTGAVDNPVSRQWRENFGLGDAFDANSEAYRAGGFVAEAAAAYGAARSLAARSASVFFPCRCFEAGTLVKTRTGDVPIEDIKAGDEVACTDVATGEWGWCEVLEPFSKMNDEGLVRLAIAGEELVSSESHPYWVVHGEHLTYRPAPTELAAYELVRGHDGGRWVMARDLRVGDLLRLATGSIRVENVALEGGASARIPVFNLVVQGMHNFMVEEVGVLVHNGCGNATAKTRELFGRQGPREFTGNHIKRLKKRMKRDGFDPAHPIDIAEVNGRKIIIDGHHRARAAGAVGIKEVPVRVHQVDAATSARLESEAAQAAHELGLPF